MKKKKMIRNIIIAALVAIVIIGAILLSVALRDDYRGYNWFERSRKVASAEGEKVTFGELAVAFDNLLYGYESSGYDLSAYSEDEIRELQKNTAESLLLQKLYIKKCEELGLELTAEEKAECREQAENEVKAIEEEIAKMLIENGSYAASTYEAQVASYYNRNIGMNKTQYKSYVTTQAKSAKCLDKLEEYYSEQMTDYTEDDLQAYYEETVQTNFIDLYQGGIYSTYMLMYQLGYYAMPYLYVPEDFIYIDLITVTAEDEATINEFYARLDAGETFEDLMADEKNINAMKDVADGPYAIGAEDYSYLVSDAEVFTQAQQLATGEIGVLITDKTSTDADGNETVTYTGYIFRRAEGAMCVGGAATGIVNMDHYAGVRAEVELGMQQDKFSEIALTWLENEVLYEALYEYESAHLQEGHTH